MVALIPKLIPICVGIPKKSIPKELTPPVAQLFALHQDPPLSN